MDSVIRGDNFHTRKNRPLPGIQFRHDSFSKKPRQEEEQIPENQRALFGLWLRRLPERLASGL